MHVFISGPLMTAILNQFPRAISGDLILVSVPPLLADRATER